MDVTGCRGKRFAIITPYYKEDRGVLERCIQSVKDQSVPADQFLISDGFPQDWLENARVRHLRLGRAHNDAGNTPRGLGALLAASEGYDGIGLLDADNWYDKSHVEECCKAAYSTAETPTDLVFAKRRIFLPDGQSVNIQEEIDHVDTSCFWFLPGSFHLLHYWTIMPQRMGPACDRIFYRMIRAQSLTIRNTEEITVNFTSIYAFHYRALGITPPRGAKDNVDLSTVWEQIKQLNSHQQELIKRRCGFDTLAFAHAQLFQSTNSRNAPCFCGSGKRFKHCHGKLPAIQH